MASDFVFLYTKNHEGKGVKEGVRYGTYVGLIVAAINNGAYAVLPIPMSLMLGWSLVFL